MIFAFIGLVWIIIATLLYPHLVLIGFGFVGFDLTIELVNLKTQLYYVGKAIRDKLVKKND